jgi:hypothetical protein
MKSYRKLFTVFILISIIFLVNALEAESYLFKIFLYWLAFSYTFIALIYFINKANSFFKNKDSGKIPVFIILLTIPYFLLIYSIWYFKYKFSKENKINFFFENYYIGKKILFQDLPNEIEVVIDLTSEFNEDSNILKNRKYILFPILDGSIPDIDDFYLFIKEISKIQSNIYIHCAEGHGRTALVGIVLYLIKNKKCSFEDGLTFIKSKRDNIRLNNTQEEFLKEFIKSEYFVNI